MSSTATAPVPAPPAWAPRYWIPGYDTPSIAAPILLLVTVVLMFVLPARKVPVVHRTPPPPPMAATLILQPQSTAVLAPMQPFELSGSAQPGGTVRLYFGTALLTQTVAGADGAYRFQLAKFPAGTHSLRVETVFRGRSMWSTELPLRFEAPKAPAPKATAASGKNGKSTAKKKPQSAVLKH
jgi:hypothetical protein